MWLKWLNACFASQSNQGEKKKKERRKWLNSEVTFLYVIHIMGLKNDKSQKI
jgi:hypothetical protein